MMSNTMTTTRQAGTGDSSITLLESAHNDGPWSRRLTRPLGRAGVPVQFYVCGVRGPVNPKEPCLAASPSALPAGSAIRLEQQPVGPGVERADTPGWGLVATADSQTFKVVLSDFVSTNNKPATVTYRATLRDRDGKILGMSDTATVTWHR